MAKKSKQQTVSHRTGAEVRPQQTTPASEETKQAKKKINARSVFLFWFILLAMLLIFGGAWVRAIMNSYFSAFVERGDYAAEAVENMEGLTLSDEEETVLLPLQRQWDAYISSRLRDEVTTTADDGVELHGYLYNEGSDVTVVVVPRFDGDGTGDFLPGSWLYEQTGCNFLLIDPRAHGGSGGDYFTFGVQEQYDLVSWLTWAEQELGEQTFILWGEGTGANTILYAESSGLLPDSVAFAVAESPYASLHTMAVSSIWKWYQVPAVPFLYAIEFKLAHSDAGYTVKDLELADTLSASDCSLPVLFLESTVDDYILPEWTEEVYQAYSGEKDLISGGLNHGTVYAYCADEVQQLLLTGSYALS